MGGSAKELVVSLFVKSDRFLLNLVKRILLGRSVLDGWRVVSLGLLVCFDDVGLEGTFLFPQN